MAKSAPLGINRGQIERAFTILQKATKANPITSEELGIKLGITDVEGNPLARSVITEVIREKHLPLGATAHGYFVMTTTEDLKEYRADLNRRIAGTLDRIRLVEEAFEKTHGVQAKDEPADLTEEP
jgi:hypothetical protein